MSLLAKARKRRDERSAEQAEDRQRRLRDDAMRILPEVRRKLELDPDQIGLEDLHLVLRHGLGERSLWGFEVEGLTFIAGHFWVHGGNAHFLAVQVKSRRGPITEWPPPDPESVGNVRWAPENFRAVYGLAELAEVVDGA